MRHLPWIVLVSALPLPAQKLPDPIDSGSEIQLHDVRAVLEAIDLRPQEHAPAAGAESEEALAERRRARLEDLVELARAFVDPPLLDSTHVHALGADLLVLRGDPQQQASLEGILRALSRLEDESIAVECELLSVPQATFATKVLPILGLEQDPGGGAAAQVTLDQERDAALSAALRGIEGVTVGPQPRLSVLPAQHSSLKSTETIYYRRDYEVEVKGDGRVKGVDYVVWPITDKLEDGLALELRAAPLGEETLGVWIQASISEVDRPIPTFETHLAGDVEKLVLDLPSMTTRHFEAALRMRDGECGVVVGGSAADPQRQLLLVRATRI